MHLRGCPVSADAARVPGAGQRAADLRRAGARRRPGPRRGRRRSSTASRRTCPRCWRLRQLAVLARTRHRIRQLAQPGGRAGPRPGPPAGGRRPAEYDRMVNDLIASGAISDPGMVYFDVRPSAHAPTVELGSATAARGRLRRADRRPVPGAGRARGRSAARRRAAAERPQPLGRAPPWRAARSGPGGRPGRPRRSHARPAAEVVIELVDCCARSWRRRATSSR